MPTHVAMRLWFLVGLVALAAHADPTIGELEVQLAMVAPVGNA